MVGRLLRQFLGRGLTVAQRGSGLAFMQLAYGPEGWLGTRREGFIAAHDPERVITAAKVLGLLNE